jgi:ABC-type Mn2+/Zn2+ transport system permease subunit
MLVLLSIIVWYFSHFMYFTFKKVRVLCKGKRKVLYTFGLLLMTSLHDVNTLDNFIKII